MITLPVPMRARGHVYDLACALALALAGFCALVLDAPPQNIEAIAPAAVAHVWSALLLVGGLAVWASYAWTDLATAYLVEGGGVAALSCGTAAYAAASVQWMVTPWQSSPAVWLAVCLSVAGVVRLVELRRTLQEIRAWT